MSTAVLELAAARAVAALRPEAVELEAGAAAPDTERGVAVPEAGRELAAGCLAAALTTALRIVSSLHGNSLSERYYTEQARQHTLEQKRSADSRPIALLLPS